MKLLQTFGAEVVQVRTASISNPQHYINVAARLAAERPGAVFMDQFETMANFRAHFSRTALEIWDQTGGRCVRVVYRIFSRREGRPCCWDAVDGLMESTNSIVKDKNCAPDLV